MFQYLNNSCQEEEEIDILATLKITEYRFYQTK